MSGADSWPADQAAMIAELHKALNPEHVIAIVACTDCHAPTGMYCTTCRDSLCGIKSVFH
jgi:hypothetical protein